MEPRICEDNHGIGKLGNQGLKMRVVDIGGGTVPRTNQRPLVQDKTELASDDPPMIALAFLADLRWATPFRMG